MEKWTSLIQQILTSTFEKPGTVLDTVDSLGNKTKSSPVMECLGQWRKLMRNKHNQWVDYTASDKVISPKENEKVEESEGHQECWEGFQGNLTKKVIIWTNSYGGEVMSQADIRRWASQTSMSWHRGSLRQWLKAKVGKLGCLGFSPSSATFQPCGFSQAYFLSPCFVFLIYEMGMMTSQGLENYCLWTKSHLLIVFANKVLLAHSHSHSFRNCLQLLSHYNGGVEWF